MHVCQALPSMFVDSLTDSLDRVVRFLLVNLMREQVKSLSSIGLSVVSLSDLKKVEAEKVLGKAAHSVVFDKRQPEICLRSQAIVNSETETFFSDANVSNVYRKGCEL